MKDKWVWLCKQKNIERKQSYKYKVKFLPGELACLQVETGCGVKWYRDLKVGLIIPETKFLKFKIENIKTLFSLTEKSCYFYICNYQIRKALSKQKLIQWSLSICLIYFSASWSCSYPYLTVFLCQKFDWLRGDQGWGWGMRVCPTRFRCIDFLFTE